MNLYCRVFVAANVDDFNLLDKFNCIYFLKKIKIGITSFITLFYSGASRNYSYYKKRKPPNINKWRQSFFQ